jgi:hypothetical protein
MSINPSHDNRGGTMTASAIDGGNDNPVFLLMDAQEIAPSTTAPSKAVAVQGARSVCFISAVNQNATRDVQVSDDGESWYNVMTAGSVYPSLGLITTGVSSVAVIFDPGGARFARRRVSNTGSSPMTATVKAMLAPK